MHILLLTKTCRMRTILKALLIIASSMASVCTARAQTYFLSVDSVVGIPDTIVNGQIVSFTLFLTNQSNLVYQGGIDVVLEFSGTSDSLLADSAVLSNDFLPSQMQTQVFVTHQFTTEGNNAMVIGDNVVVVWPRIHNGPIEPVQEVVKEFTTSFYLINPLSVRDVPYKRVQPLKLYPNPADDEVRLSLPPEESILRVELTDLAGRTLSTSHEAETLSVRHLPQGLYGILVRCHSGAVYRGRLTVR